MGLLEVHDGRGRVERVRIAPDDPTLFGASPACAVVIGGADVAPIHGRIRWRKGRYKVDAGADVDAIEVNGKRVRSSTLYQGDEIRVGSARIFVISTEDGPADPAGRPPADDRTLIRAAPAAFGTPVARPVSAPTPLRRASRRESSEEDRKSRRSRRKRADLESIDGLLGPAGPADGGERREAPRGPWSRLVAGLVRGDDAAPGAERIWRSPIVIGLAITFVVVLLAGVGLHRIIRKSAAERQYAKAFESLNDGDYRNAIKQLDQFLAENPRDKRAEKAEVYRALANVRQFTSQTGASWDNAFQAARAMVSGAADLPSYQDASIELAEQLVKVVEGLAERARSGSDPILLAEAEAALALQRQVAGEAATRLLQDSRALPKLEQARAGILRTKAKTAALAAIDKALAETSADRAYDLRDDLIGRYPDLAPDRDLVARLVKANDLIRKAARFDPTSRPGATEPQPDPLGPPTTLVLRLEPATPATARPTPAYALVDGIAYGLDAATGAVLWGVPAGSSAPFPPRAVAGGEPTALMVDARYDDLRKLDGRTGRLLWRQGLGEPVVDPPLVLGNQVYQTTPSGKLLVIDLATGTLRGTIGLGRRLARSAVGDESGRFLYVLGEEDTLFVIDRDSDACVGVEYLGHDAGSIGATPARTGRFLVVPINAGIDSGRLQVFALDDGGPGAKPRQTIPVAGWTWQTPAVAGQVLWSASDRGEVAPYSIGLYDAPTPLKPLSGLGAENGSVGPAFTFARSDRELWVASARSARLDLNPETGKLSGAWSLGQAGPAAAPIQSVGRMAVYTQEAGEGAGVALWGVDPGSGAVRWRTTLGAAWPVAVRAGESPGSIATLGFDGERLGVDGPRIEAGGFVDQPLSRAGTFRLPALGTTWLDCAGVTVLVPSERGSQILARSSEGPFRPIDLPSPLGARPIAWGGDVLVPGGDGRVYLIDPKTGESAADPFVPRFNRATQARWRTPVALDGGAVALADEAGLIRRLVRVEGPRARLVVEVETKLGKPLDLDPASTGAALLVATSDRQVRSLAARDLSPIATFDLAAPIVAGPFGVDGHGFVGDASGTVTIVSADGSRLPPERLSAPLASAPAVADGFAWLVGRDGSVVKRRLDGSSPAVRLVLGILPAGDPVVSGSLVVFPTGRGTFRPLRAPGETSGSDAGGLQK